MDDLWQRVGRLKGQTLVTTGRGRSFDVVDVRPDAVVITVHSTGKVRRVPRSEIEAAAKLGITGLGLTPQAIRDAGASEANPASVAAILEAVYRTGIAL